MQSLSLSEQLTRISQCLFTFDNSDLGMEFGRGLVNNFVKYSLCPTLPAKFGLGVRREGGVVWLCCVTSVK